MPVVPLQCPLCAGLLEIDTALAGQQVACPLCQGVVALPPAEFFAAMYAPPAAPQMPTDVMQLACPLCTGPFQVPLAMAGQQVACPHCGSGVMLPPLETPLAAAVEVPSHTPLATEDVADPLAMLPPTMEAHAVPQPAPPPVKSPSVKPPANERLPPGSRSPTAPPSKKEPSTPTPVSDRRPPGSERMPPPGKPTPVVETPRRDEPSMPPQPRREPVSERLPPTAMPKLVERVEAPKQPPPEPLVPPDKASVPGPKEEPTSIESLLPPGADVAAPLPSPVTAAPVRPARVIDSLLPPGAASEETGPAVPDEQVPIPAAPESRPITANLPAGMAAVPTADGGFITIRETPRTIGEGDDEVELKRLSVEEKSARRFRRNLILWGICLVILFGVLVAMMW